MHQFIEINELSILNRPIEVSITCLEYYSYETLIEKCLISVLSWEDQLMDSKFDSCIPIEERLLKFFVRYLAVHSMSGVESFEGARIVSAHLIDFPVEES